MLKFLFIALTAHAAPDGLTEIDLKSLTDAVGIELAKCPASTYHFEVANLTSEYLDKTKVVGLLAAASGKADKASAPELKVELAATYSETDKMRKGKYTLKFVAVGCTGEARMNKVTRK